MRTIILCPGPSADAFDEGDFAGMVIAADAVAGRRPCDVWACADAAIFAATCTRISGRPALLTTAVIANGLIEPWPRPVRLIDSAWMRAFCPVRGWELFAATAAVVYATMLGAHEIEIVGADEGSNWCPAQRQVLDDALIPWLECRRVKARRRSEVAEASRT